MNFNLINYLFEHDHISILQHSFEGWTFNFKRQVHDICPRKYLRHLFSFLERIAKNQFFFLNRFRQNQFRVSEFARNKDPIKPLDYLNCSHD